GAVLAAAAAAVPRYLAKPDVTVKVWEEGAKEPRVLLLAPSRETRGGQPAAVAAVAGHGPVVLVEAKALSDIGVSADAVRDKSLMPAFELGDVKRARLAGAGKTLTVERKGDADWQGIEPGGGPPKGGQVRE